LHLVVAVKIYNEMGTSGNGPISCQ